MPQRLPGTGKRGSKLKHTSRLSCLVNRERDKFHAIFFLDRLRKVNRHSGTSGFTMPPRDFTRIGSQFKNGGRIHDQSSLHFFYRHPRFAQHMGIFRSSSSDRSSFLAFMSTEYMYPTLHQPLFIYCIVFFLPLQSF